MVQEELAALAGEVAPFDHEGSELLESLRSALDPDADPGGWVGVAPSAVIDVDAIVEAMDGGDGSRGRAGKFEVLRNVLILVPVILTWAGLFYAALGYQTAIALDPTLAGEPFLLLWEQEFRGLLQPPLSSLGFLRLSNVAIADVGVLLVVIALTAWIQREVSVVDHARAVRARAMSRRITHALGRASLELAQRATIPALVDAFQKTSTALTEELAAERTHIQELGDDRERILNDMRGAARELRAATAGFANASAENVASSEQLADAITALRADAGAAVASTDSLTSAIGVQLEELRHDHEVAKGIEQVLGGLAKSMLDTLELALPAVAQLGAGASEIQTSAESLIHAISEDAQTRHTISEELRTAGAAITSAAQAAREAVFASTAASAEIGRAVEDIRASSKQIADAAALGVASSREGADTIAGSVNGMSNVAERLNGSLQASNTSNAMIVQSLQSAANELTQAVAQLNRSARAPTDRRPPPPSEQA